MLLAVTVDLQGCIVLSLRACRVCLCSQFFCYSDAISCIYLLLVVVILVVITVLYT